jgi:predicted  nucleic acid-binding Zn-ribbon protein
MNLRIVGEYMNKRSPVLFVFFIVLLAGQTIIKSMPIPVGTQAPAALPGTIPAPVVAPIPTAVPEVLPTLEMTPIPEQIAPIGTDPMMMIPAAPITPAPIPMTAQPAPMVAQQSQPIAAAPAPMFPTPATPAPYPATNPFPTQAAPQFPSVPSTVTAQTYKQELDKVTADIDSINALKSTLKSQLADLDTKLGQAQEQLATTKKLSFELLSKEDETEAGKVLESMKQNLATMQQTQKTIDTTTVQEFNNTVTSIRNLMASVQTQLQSLESKSTALKAAGTASIPSTAIPPAPAPSFAGMTSMPLGSPAGTPPAISAPAAPTTKIVEQAPVQKTLIHKFFNTVADIVTGSITMSASFLSSIKEMIIPTQPTVDELEKMRILEEAKKKIVPPPSAVPKTPIAQSITTPAFTQAIVGKQTFPTPQAPIGSPAFVDQVKANIAAIDQVTKKLDDQRVSVKQMVKDIKKQAKSLTHRIDQNPELKERTSGKLTFNGAHKGEWKKTAGTWFEKILNILDQGIEFVGSAYNKIVQAGKKAWQSTRDTEKKDTPKTPASVTPSSK